MSNAINDHQAVIDSRRKWNDTGIRLRADGTYALTASGIWTDWFIDSDAEGNPDPALLQRLAEGMLRAQIGRAHV